MTAELRIDQSSTGGSAARRDLAATRSEMDRFGRSATTSGSAAGKSSGRLRNMGASVGMLAKSFGPLAAVAGAGLLVKFGVDAVRAASDTEQAMGAMDSVFGRNARAIKAWAADAADSVGLAKSEYGNLSVVLGSMLKNQGIKEFTGQTHELIALGADLAAQFGGSTKEAVEAIGSLMRGETDPIERYGVSINQTGINARLAAIGQDKLKGAALRTAQAHARLFLLTKQTTSAQGAFRRESNTLAGAQQRLGAKFTNLKSTIGAKLIPTVTKLVSWLSNTISGSNKTSATLRKIAAVARSYVTPIIRGATGAFKDITRAFAGAKKNGDGFGSACRAIGSVVKKVAPIIGSYLGFQLRLIGKIIAGSITAINKWVNMVRSIAGFARDAAGAVRDLIGALGNIHVPHISFPKIPGIFRSAPGTGGLVRAAGATAGRGGVSFAPSFSVAPIVRVSIGRRELRAVIVDVVQGELREQTRRDNGGGDRE